MYTDEQPLLLWSTYPLAFPHEQGTDQYQLQHSGSVGESRYHPKAVQYNPYSLGPNFVQISEFT